MHIAQIAPLHESVPPKLYGGTERVVSYLTEALVDLGHKVTLFASGDSITKADLVPCCHRALRLDKKCIDPLAYHVVMMEKVRQQSSGFHLIHNHNDYTAYPMLRKIVKPNLTTLHGRLDIPELQSIYQEFNDIPLVSISNSQRAPLPYVNWSGTVYHGLPKDLYKFQPGPGKYLAFIGRVSPEKRVDSAIEIALALGMPLKIAAKVDRVDEEYYMTKIKPMMQSSLIEFIGEIGEAEKGEFLGSAIALLFPIDWPEPFGLCMIEAMACGTPVIARRRGSVEEVMRDGVSGYIIDTIEEAVEAVKKVSLLSRKGCREEFENRFTAERMAKDYLALYEGLLKTRTELTLAI